MKSLRISAWTQLAIIKVIDQSQHLMHGHCALSLMVLLHAVTWLSAHPATTAIQEQLIMSQVTGGRGDLTG